MTKWKTSQQEQHQKKKKCFENVSKDQVGLRKMPPPVLEDSYVPQIHYE